MTKAQRKRKAQLMARIRLVKNLSGRKAHRWINEPQVETNGAAPILWILANKDIQVDNE